MEVNPVSYIEITLYSNEKENEVQQFRDFMIRAYKESTKAGLKNMFENDREIIKKIMEGMNIKVDQEELRIVAGDTHTQEQ